MMACDFFTVEAIWLKTIFVLFFIELETRRIHMAGCTTNPEAIWVTQQARQLVWKLKDESRKMAFLIHDNDTNYPSSFDKVFSPEGIDVVHTPFRAPRENAYAERWVRSVREEYLDHILVLNENHLRIVLRAYTDFYIYSRSNQGISQHFPVSGPERSTKGLIRRQDILGGIIHNYFWQLSVAVSGYG